VSTYVTYLRRKLTSDGPDLIHTQRAVGYSLRLPSTGQISTGRTSTGRTSTDEGQASSDGS
jgi:hypothetical protein